MPRNLSTGVYSPPAGTLASYGAIISPTSFDAWVSDVGTEITNSLDVRGEAPMQAALNLGNFKVVNLAAGVNPSDAANVSQLTNSIPPGTVTHTLRTTAPSGWFLLNGQAISRAGNPVLFGIIGITFGSGDGSTTFNLPDPRNDILICSGATYALGATGGATTQTLGIPNLPSHNHGINESAHSHVMTHGHGTTETPHSHSGVVTGFSGGVSISSGTGVVAVGGSTATTSTGLTVNNFTGSTATASTGITTQNAGSGNSFSIMPPYFALTLIVKGG